MKLENPIEKEPKDEVLPPRVVTKVSEVLQPISVTIRFRPLRQKSVIPPSRAFIFWRLFHNKIPTDENLRKRGSCIVSICRFCLKQSESSEHIFLGCPVTFSLWDWLMKGGSSNILKRRRSSDGWQGFLNVKLKGVKTVVVDLSFSGLINCCAGKFNLLLKCRVLMQFGEG